MPMIFISEEKREPLMMDPYLTLNRKFDDLGEEINGKQIKYRINRHNSGFYEGFELDRYYCDDVSLKFTFSKNKQATMKDEEYLIHHVIEYDFDEAFEETQKEATAGIRKRLDYLYYPDCSYMEYSYCIEGQHVQMNFDVLTEERNVKNVMNLLVNQDILIFSRGW